MATDLQEIRTTYPLPVYNYVVEIAGTTIAFSEVSGLSVGFETTTYKESSVDGSKPGPRVMHMPAQPKSASVTLKKGLVRGKSVALLYEWLSSTRLHLVEKKDITVRLCDEEGRPVISWKVLNAFPTQLDAPSFSSDSNDVAVESLQLMADTVLVEESS